MRAALSDEPLIARAVAGDAPPLLAPLVGGRLSPPQALGLDLILEGFLLHRGRARVLAATDRDDALLLGDYCYARGLVRVAEAGDLYAIEALSELIAASTGLVADGATHGLAALWRVTVGAIASADPALRAALAEAREALVAGDAAPISALASALETPPELMTALEDPHGQENAA